MLRAVITGAILIPDMLMSRRVAATFVEHRCPEIDAFDQTAIANRKDPLIVAPGSE